MSTFEIPQEFQDRLRSLGEFVAGFRAWGSHLLFLWIMAIFFFLFGPAMLAFAVVTLHNNQAGVRDWGISVKAVVGGLSSMAFGLECLRRIRKVRGLRVFAFTEGLARIEGDSVDLLRWTDVTLIRRSSLPSSKRKPLEPARKLILIGTDNKQFEFDESLSGLRQLRELVEQYTLPHLFPPVLDTCEAGSAYLFGEVRVNREGLTYRGVQLPWELCANVEVAKGRLIVKKEGAWLAFCKIPIAKVPNVHVLIAYAEYIRKYAD